MNIVYIFVGVGGDYSFAVRDSKGVLDAEATAGREHDHQVFLATPFGAGAGKEKYRSRYPSAITARGGSCLYVSQRGVAVKLTRFRQVGLRYDGDVGRIEETGIFKRLIVAFGRTDQHNPVVLAQVV